MRIFGERKRPFELSLFQIQRDRSRLLTLSGGGSDASKTGLNLNKLPIATPSSRPSLKLFILLIFLQFNVPVLGAEGLSRESDQVDLIQDQLQQLRLQRQQDDLGIWDRYVRRFRRDHHIAFNLGWDRGRWNVGSFGRVRDHQFKSEGIDATVQYSFHLQIYGKFGYYLGSSGGYYSEFRRRDDDFGPSSMWKLPGIAAGLAYNFSSSDRLLLGGEAYLSRIVRLESRDETGESVTIAVTGETYDVTATWDKFIALTWGVRVMAYERKIWVPRPKAVAGYPLDAKVSRTSRGVSLGTIYHFL